MTLRKALELNLRIASLPYSMACQVRDLELEVIEEILEDPRQPLLYLKIDRFEHELELLKRRATKPAA